jgi:gliding motility-associated-like protein
MVMKKTFLYLVGLVACSASVMAQNGRFDAKLSLKKLDCATRTLDVEVQVKAHDEKSLFRMGDANFRLSYNPQKIRNPDIQSQELFSSMGQKADANYGVQNLNGSMARMNNGVVSLNTFYTGADGGAVTVSEEWSTVSVLRFDIVDAKGLVELKWNDSNSFPQTGMSEVNIKPGTSGDFDYESFAVKDGGLWENLKLNLADVCKANAEVSPDRAFFIPEGFSPDGDGINDRFVIKNPEALQVNLQVYDRHGTLLYKNDDYQNEWDGRPNVSGWAQGRPVEPGTYYYVIRRSDGKQYTRFMTVMY